MCMPRLCRSTSSDRCFASCLRVLASSICLCRSAAYARFFSSAATRRSRRSRRGCRLQAVEPLRPRPLFVVLVEHHAGRIARLAAAVRESRVTVIVTHRAASAFLFQRGFPVSFLARLLLVVLRLTLASEHFLLDSRPSREGPQSFWLWGVCSEGCGGGARPPPGGPMPPGGPPGGPSNRPAGPPAAKNRSRSSRSIARVRFATERNFLSDLFVPRYRTARYGARAERRGCLGHSVERRWRCARILGAPGGAARGAAALRGSFANRAAVREKSQRHDVCRLLGPVEVPPDRQSSLQKPKKHFFNKRRKKERLVGATSRSAREELSSEQTSMRGRATSVSRDGSVLGERRELAPRVAVGRRPRVPLPVAVRHPVRHGHVARR